jgi:glycosyltransferase involved in cell wall biosynthesis
MQVNNKTTPEKPYRVFLYANQPVSRFDGRYFTKMKNFVDFLGGLSSRYSEYCLVVPCNLIEETHVEQLIPITLPDDTEEVNAYEGHTQALLSTLPNALRICRLVKKSLAQGHSVTMAGPGPNAMLFILSWLLPKDVMFAFFIRGDTAKTVENMYKGRLIGHFATRIVRIFQKRIYRLLAQRRAIAFTYGTKLQGVYGKHGSAFSIAPLIESTDISGSNQQKRMAAATGRFRVLFVGRLSYEKGILDLVNACADAYKQGQPFQLTIIGHGPLAETIKELIHTHELQTCVTFVGYVPHGEKLMAYFDSHDLLCLPSYTEGVPRVVIEAFARGLFVTATPVGSIPDLFSEHLHLIENNSPRAILEAIDWCRSHTRQVTELAAKLPEVAQLYTLEHYAPIVREQLERLALKG